MADNALALIQAKIAEVEERLGKLKVAGAELASLGKQVGQPARGRKPRLTVVENDDGRADTITALIREVLAQSDGLSAAQVCEAVALKSRREVNNRTVSFTLQALKRRGEARNRNRVWSLVRRRRRA